MSTLSLWRLFHRLSARQYQTRRQTSILAVVAFAAAAAIFLTVLGGVHGFIWRASADHTLHCLLNSSSCSAANPYSSEGQMMYGTYVALAVFACMLLAVPFAALAGSAARLAASRADNRLACLRLVGATSGQVARLMAVEAAGQALLGSCVGIVGYTAMIPAIMLLKFENRHFTFEELWVGPWILLGVLLAVTVLALVSSLMTLRRIAISPLGVTRRVSTPMPARWRVVVFLACMAGAVAVLRMQSLFAGAGEITVFVVMAGVIVLSFALLNLVGSWVVAVRARAKARRPKNVATMIAMRRILDNPKRAWRNVSGIALAVFVAGITSVASYLSAASADSAASMDAQSAMLIRDINTGSLLTLAFAAVLAAVSCGIMQSENVYEQASQYRLLLLEGTDMATLNRARSIEVFTPLATVVVVSAGCSMLLMLPLFSSAMVQPVTLASFAGGIVMCFALVFIGVFASTRVAAGMDFLAYRDDD